MFHITMSSNNKKTGPIPVTTTSAVTCPTSCPFNHKNAGGCYAESGPLAMHWKAVTEGKRGGTLDALIDAIKRIPRGMLWRHNQAGDLPGTGNRINANQLARIVAANKKRRGFTYTHKPLTDANKRAIESANANGFTINVSANNLQHADALTSQTTAPIVAVVAESWNTRAGKTRAGNRYVQCPATVDDRVTCATCGLCQKQTTSTGARRPIVVFPAHGASKRKATAIATVGE